MIDVEKLQEKLKGIASCECWRDNKDFTPYDYSGGNIDDAYYGGNQDGGVELARILLKDFFEPPERNLANKSAWDDGSPRIPGYAGDPP